MNSPRMVGRRQRPRIPPRAGRRRSFTRNTPATRAIASALAGLFAASLASRARADVSGALDSVGQRASAESSLQPAPTRNVHAIAVEAGSISYSSARYPLSANAVGASYRFSPVAGLELAAGLRGLWGPGVAGGSTAEGFLSGALAPELGLWRPRAGLEIGYSGLVSSNRPPTVTLPPGVDEDYEARLSPLYASVIAAPLRMRVWHFDVTAFEFDVGSTLPDLGRGLRTALFFSRIEWRI
jgi:hypothetical protein